MAVEHLTKETFKEKIFDYEKNKEWVYKGKNPSIIDFYAKWCGPCKIVAPILEELSEEYHTKLDIYKVNTEEEQELAAVFGISSIPSILFIPVDDKPQMGMGALPKETFRQLIKEIFDLDHEV
jgi:thioredoxin 1